MRDTGRRNREYKKKRELPTNLKLSIMFGNTESIIGFVFLIFGLFFAGTFLSIAFSTDDRIPNATFNYATITKTERDTSYKTNIYTYSFNHNGVDYYGTFQSNEYYAKDDSLGIYFNNQNPHVSSIANESSEGIPSFVFIFLFIFPLIGATFIYIKAHRGLVSINVIEVGTETRGTLIKKEPTNVYINKQRVYKYHFQFQDNKGRNRTAVARSHSGYELEDEPTELIYYNPYNSEEAVVIDELPRSVKKYLQNN